MLPIFGKRSAFLFKKVPQLKLGLLIRTFSSGQNYYDLLGVDKNASDSEIKKAYFKKVKKYHPDQNNSSQAKEKFQEISKAYETLGKPEKRKIYDIHGERSPEEDGHPGFDQRGNFDFGGPNQDINANDIFSQFFGGGFNVDPSEMHNIPQRGRHVRLGIRISFMDAVNGCQKELTFNRKASCQSCSGSGNSSTSKPSKCSKCKGKGKITAIRGPMMFQSTCRKCNGTGKIERTCWTCSGNGLLSQSKTLRVNIPAGVDDGSEVRVSGYGDEGTFNGEAGDLLVQIHAEKHPYFERQGADIHINVDVPFEEAILGDKKLVKTLTNDVLLTIKPGTQPGEIVRMAGKGIKVLNRFRYGDQYVHFKVTLPTKLSEEQKKVLVEYKTLVSGDKESDKDKEENKHIEKVVGDQVTGKPKKKRSKGFFKRIFER